MLFVDDNEPVTQPESVGSTRQNFYIEPWS